MHRTISDLSGLVPDAEWSCTVIRPFVVELFGHTAFLVFMARDLPLFRPVTQVELRYFWSNPPESRRRVLEVERYRRVISQIDALYKTTNQAWRDHLAAT